MKSRTTLSRISLATLCLAACAASSCAKPPGELVLVLQTDMSLPKDVDAIVIEVLVRGDTRYSNEFDQLGSDGSIQIPASLGVVVGPNTDETTPITFRVTAKQNNVPRVLRETVTTVPPTNVVSLRMAVQWLCWDQVQPDPMGNPQTTCADGQTCVAGSCVDKTVDSSKLPPYSAPSVFGGGTGKNNDGSCFDVTSCFTGSIDAPVDMTTCSITPIGKVNVALRVESAGICGPSGCFVPLDANSDGGWQPGPNGTILLPAAICSKTPLPAGPVTGVSVSGVTSACALKTESLPTCGPWSSSGKSPPPPSATTPVPFVTNQNHPVSLAVAGGNVYWTSSGTSTTAAGAVKTMPTANSTTITTLASLQAFPKDIALDVNAKGMVAGVYWTTNGVTGTAGGIAGWDVTNAAKITFPVIPGLKSPEGLTVQGGALYFTDFSANTLYTVNLTSQAGAAIASATTDPTLLSPDRIVADAATIYWTNESGGSVMMLDRATSKLVVISKAEGTPRDLAVDLDANKHATALYWTDYGSGNVMTAPITAGPPATAGTPSQVATKQASPYGIALDATSVYWTNSGDGTVVRIPKAQPGSAPVVLATGQASPGAIAVDSTGTVYWINQGTTAATDGAIMKVKP